jgi:hypothetical protein
MAVTSSRRDVLQLGYGAPAPGALGPVPALPQGATWRKPETAVLIHGNAESSVVWYAWLLDRHAAALRMPPPCPGNGPPVRFRAGSLARKTLRRAFLSPPPRASRRTGLPVVGRAVGFLDHALEMAVKSIIAVVDCTTGRSAGLAPFHLSRPRRFPSSLLMPKPIRGRSISRPAASDSRPMSPASCSR